MRMTRVALGVCLVFVLGWGGTGFAAEGDSTGPKELLGLPEEAQKAIQSGDWEAAVKALTPLVTGEAKPSEPVDYWYGVALLQQGKPAEAIPHFTASLEAVPGSVTTGRYLARAGREAKSEEAIEAALAAFPTDSVVLTEAGRHTFRRYTWYMHARSTEAERREGRQRRRKALELGRAAVAADPADVEARMFLAEVLGRSNKDAEAVEHMLAAARLKPMGWDGYKLLAECCWDARDYDGSAAAYAALAEAAPSQAHSANGERAHALRLAGRYDEAVEVFREYFKDHFVDTKVRYYLGQAAYEAGDYPLALFGFRESYEADGNLSALAWSAQCAYELGQDELALKLIDQAIAEGKEGDKDFYVSASWHFTKGRALWQLGRKEEAVVDLEEAVRKASTEENVTWAVYAFRELDDPFGIIRVLRWHGMSGHGKEAVTLLGDVPRLYPGLRSRDHRGKSYPGGVRFQCMLAVCDVYEHMKNYKAAWNMCKGAGLDRGRNISARTAWIAVRAGELGDAKRMFQELTKNESTQWAGGFGLAYVHLLERDGDAAGIQFIPIVAKTKADAATTALRWANLYAGKPDAVEKLDAFDLLGIYGASTTGYGDSCGVYVEGLLPDSPLAKTYPKVEPKDVIILVDDWQLRGEEGIAGLRGAPLPRGPTLILARRGYKTFEITVDFEATHEALRKKPTGTTKEEKEGTP